MKRVKRRYLALQIDSDAVVSPKELLDAVWAAVTKLHGEYGASLAGLALVDYDADKKTAIIRVTVAALQSVRASIALITRLADKEAAVHVVAVSGTIKSLDDVT